MGFWDNGSRDTSTPEQRQGWRDRAEQQMAEQNGEQQRDQDTQQSSGHRRARRPQ